MMRAIKKDRMSERGKGKWREREGKGERKRERCENINRQLSFQMRNVEQKGKVPGWIDPRYFSRPNISSSGQLRLLLLFSTEFVDFSKHEDPLNNAPDNLYSQHSMRKRWPVELIAALG